MDSKYTCPNGYAAKEEVTVTHTTIYHIYLTLVYKGVFGILLCMYCKHHLVLQSCIIPIMQ